MTNQNDIYDCGCGSTTSSTLPVFLLSIAVVGFLLFQTYSIVADRIALDTAYEQQEKPLEEVTKVKEQVSALIRGIVDLSQKGNKSATIIIDDMKKAGVTFQEDQEPAEK